jgi:hypothetical protein
MLLTLQVILILQQATIRLPSQNNNLLINKYMDHSF